MSDSEYYGWFDDEDLFCDGWDDLNLGFFDDGWDDYLENQEIDDFDDGFNFW